jgi:hypothetical protein
MKHMKKTTILYWIFTGLLAVLMLFSSIPDILSVPDAVTMVSTHLGYPAYFIPFIGVAKLLGVVAILVPGFPRIREWAYAGFVFDITAAIYSSISVGDPFGKWIFLFIGYIIIFGSYIYYHKRMKMLPVDLTK